MADSSWFSGGQKLEAATGTSLIESDPEPWYSDTSPLVVVRHFTRDEVLDKEIEMALRAKSVTTLRELFEDEGRCVLHLLKKDAYWELALAAFEALRRIRKTAEEILGETKIMFDTSCITQDSYNVYAPGAVSVLPLVYDYSGERTSHFSLVLGSSGSGKTMFAIRRIPEILFGPNESDYFRIHFKADTVAGVIIEHQDLSFPLAVAFMVEKTIASTLKRNGLMMEDVNKVLNIPIHVTIDEAGGEDLAEYFDAATKIEAIVDAVKTSCKFQFSRNVHVTVVGTNLETTTATIKTVEETTKFRMQPWTSHHFNEMVYASNHPNKNRALEVVHEFPILGDLCTNARCAYFVLLCLKDPTVLLESRVSSYVKVLVPAVADHYIRSNGLRSLQTHQAKWEVVRSVFKELDKSTERHKQAFFPAFEDLEDSNFRSIAVSLLDIHVEARRGAPALLEGHEFALSMSPALAIVTASLLCANAKISWDWQGFETTVMLAELKRMIVKSAGVLPHLDKPVLYMSSPLPANASRKSFKVPVVDRYTVLLNGPAAKYADVIAPYRLVQAKFSRNDEEPRLLDLQLELDKMGVTKSPNFHLQQHVTLVLYTLWENSFEAPSSTVETTKKSDNKMAAIRCESYPFSTLNSRHFFEDPQVIDGEFDDVSKTWYVEGDALGEGGMLTAFDADRPITAVFATNCTKFRFKRKGTQDEEYTTVERDDVTWEGALKKKTLPDLNLLDNVLIRFVFF